MTYPFYCLFAAIVLLYLSKVPLAMAMAREGDKGYDNRNPRDQQARLEGWGGRALAAHLNGFEITPIFAAAVITAHLFDANPWWAAFWSGLFVGSRVVYIAFYLADINLLRSAVWTVGLVCCVGLFVLAM